MSYGFRNRRLKDSGKRRVKSGTKHTGKSTVKSAIAKPENITNGKKRKKMKNQSVRRVKNLEFPKTPEKNTSSYFLYGTSFQARSHSTPEKNLRPL